MTRRTRRQSTGQPLLSQPRAIAEIFTGTSGHDCFRPVPSVPFVVKSAPPQKSHWNNRRANAHPTYTPRMLPIPLATQAVVNPNGSPSHQPNAPKTLIPTKISSFTENHARTNRANAAFQPMPESRALSFLPSRASRQELRRVATTFGFSFFGFLTSFL